MADNASSQQPGALRGNLTSRHKRLTIGLVTSGVADPNSGQVWSGAADLARELDFNLICFPGNPLRSVYGFEAQSNVVYDLISPEKVDGLVIRLAGLGHWVDQSESKLFCEHYHPLPIVTTGIVIEGIPGVTVDNYHGMYEVVSHLIERHGYSRLAFIKGPEKHQEAEVRYRAYLDALDTHDLAFDPDLVVPGNFKESGGIEAVHVLLDQRQVRFDALVGASDNMALGAMKTLQALGIRVPHDIALAGLNDEGQSAVITPPLTTSPLYFYEQTRRATEMVVAMLRGEAIPERVVLPTQILIRQSCGCPDPLVMEAVQAPSGIATSSFASLVATQHERILSEMARSGIEPVLLQQLWGSFVDQILNQAESVFLGTLAESVRTSAAAGEDQSKWHHAVSALRANVAPYLQDRAALRLCENLWQGARVLIGETAQRTQAYEVLQAEEQARTLAKVTEALSTTTDLQELGSVLTEALPRLGLPSGYLALYENPESPTEWSNLQAGYEERGQLNLESRGRRFPSRHLVPEGFLPADRRIDLVVEPLYFREEQLGFMLLEAGPDKEQVCDILRGQLSGALKRTLLTAHNVELYNHAVEAWRAAEAADQLKSRFLSTVSHELRTPLSLIAGTIEMMMQEETPRERTRIDFYQEMGCIRASAQHLAHLINDVLDLASSQAGELRLTYGPLDFQQLLQEAIKLGEPMVREKGLTWRAELPNGLQMIWGDRTRLRQVILNLISNAAKFTEKGGVVLRADIDADKVTVTVSDTGMGIPVEEQETIFDEFRQSERTAQRGYGGIGLGLAISRRLVELHGGHIGVRSSGEEGAGSTFYFTLPVIVETAAAVAAPETRARTVLLLTEHADGAEKLRQHLEQRGFEVEVLVAEGNLAWLAQVVAAPPGAVVLDLEPTEERGWELMKQFKLNPATQDVPVLFYSLSEEQDTGSLFELDYLTKPVGNVELARALERQGLRRGGNPEARTVLLVDDDPCILDMHTRLVRSHLPGCRVLQAHNGREALEVMGQTRPDLVLLDLMMPELDGFKVLEAMRDCEMTRGVPVIILTGQILTGPDMARLRQGVAAVLQKGLFTTQEVLSQLETALARSKRLASEAQRIVRQAMAYIHEHYASPISRGELAYHVGASERYLTRCFHQETGITPMAYLNRYRLKQAKTLLEQGSTSITEIALAVGFSDSAHFSRMFRQEVGMSPSIYQKGARRLEDKFHAAG